MSVKDNNRIFCPIRLLFFIILLCQVVSTSGCLSVTGIANKMINQINLYKLTITDSNLSNNSGTVRFSFLPSFELTNNNYTTSCITSTSIRLNCTINSQYLMFNWNPSFGMANTTSLILLVNISNPPFSGTFELVY